MTTIDSYTPPFTSRNSFFRPVMTFISEQFKARRAKKQARQGIAYLRTLDDRILRDIGVSRSGHHIADPNG